MTPTPVVLQGKGSTATDEFSLPFPVSIARLTHSGSANFIITAYVGMEEYLLVNEIGKYNGTRLLVSPDGEPVILDIDADGKWTAEIEPIGFTEEAAFSGRGDRVSGFFDAPEAEPWEIWHDGKRNFVVHLRCIGGSELIVNEIGAISGSTMVTFLEGPCFWEVEADGAWQLYPRSGEPAATSTPAASPVPTKKPKPKATKAPTATPKPVDYGTFPQIGQQVQAGGWTLKVMEVQKRKAVYLYNNSFVAHGHFLIVVVEVTNNQSGTSYFAKQDPWLADKAMNVYHDSGKASGYAQWMLGGLDSIYTDINPGETRRLALAFDLPDNVKDVLLSMDAPQWVYLGNFEAMQAEE